MSAKVVSLKTRPSEILLEVLEKFRVQAAEGKFNALAIVAVEPDGTKHTHIATSSVAKTDSLLAGLILVTEQLKDIIREDIEEKDEG